MTTRVFWRVEALPTIERLQVSARSGTTTFEAVMAPPDALKLIEELTNGLGELEIEVVRTEEKKRRR
jgi:hypothetical protein